MSVFSEGKEILEKARALVNNALTDEIAEIAKNEIANMVEEAVYPAYTPTQYVRRGTKGGLADRSKYQVTSGDLSLTVSDGRYEADVVENGTGYTWEHSAIYKSQPYPRPYFKQAEYNAAEAIEPRIQNILSGL